MPPDHDKVKFFVSCVPGLESTLKQECVQIGLAPEESKRQRLDDQKTAPGEEVGGLEFTGTAEQIYLCNLKLRTASRVVVRLGEFYAAAFSELRKKASRLPWELYLTPGKPVQLKVTCHKSRLYHSDGVAERVLGSINDHFSKTTKSICETKQDKDGLLVLVRLVNDLCTISIDSSGELLHRRGYRLAGAKAPLRETLAAAMILTAGWDNRSPLIDPFCGSGTIPIEAALSARRIDPGISRSFSFTEWPTFNPESWSSLVEHSKKSILPECPPLFGYDRDQGAIEMSIANASRAGQKGVIQFECQAVSYLQPTSQPGWIITNPPYGVRVSANKDLRDLYARFGGILKENFQGWHASILSSDPRLSGNLDLGQPESEIAFSNGGILVKFLQYTL